MQIQRWKHLMQKTVLKQQIHSIIKSFDYLQQTQWHKSN